MATEGGIVGLPHVGKSTLFNALTAGAAEVSNYPFTTKFPNLGIVRVDMDSSFVIADIPGLIEGAHQGVGLGHDFLKHIERAGIMVHLVEPDPMDGSDPTENYRQIRSEITLYNEQLGTRPELLVVTKSELPGAEEVRDQLAQETGKSVHLISAVTGAGLPALVQAISGTLEEFRICN